MVSFDLGISTEPVGITPEFVHFTNKLIINWSMLKQIKDDRQSCYELKESGIEKIEAFSEYTGRYYSLYPTLVAPTMLLSGIPMHRVKDTDPHTDTLAKIQVAHPAGQVLDTTTGLGYTAIQASKASEQVTTIELDPTVITLCRRNPWSLELFDNPRIMQLIGDSFEVIQTFDTARFSCVIHDPPTFSLAGDLYSAEFYAQVYRVLKPNGRFFHYIGDLNSSSGRRVARGVSQRLQQVGFQRVLPKQKAYALMAYKR